MLLLFSLCVWLVVVCWLVLAVVDCVSSVVCCCLVLLVVIVCCWLFVVASCVRVVCCVLSGVGCSCFWCYWRVVGC